MSLISERSLQWVCGVGEVVVGVHRQAGDVFEGVRRGCAQRKRRGTQEQRGDYAQCLQPLALRLPDARRARSARRGFTSVEPLAEA